MCIENENKDVIDGCGRRGSCVLALEKE